MASCLRFPVRGVPCDEEKQRLHRHAHEGRQAARSSCHRSHSRQRRTGTVTDIKPSPVPPSRETPKHHAPAHARRTVDNGGGSKGRVRHDTNVTSKGVDFRRVSKVGVNRSVATGGSAASTKASSAMTTLDGNRNGGIREDPAMDPRVAHKKEKKMRWLQRRKADVELRLEEKYVSRLEREQVLFRKLEMQKALERKKKMLIREYGTLRKQLDFLANDLPRQARMMERDREALLKQRDVADRIARTRGKRRFKALTAYVTETPFGQWDKFLCPVGRDEEVSELVELCSDPFAFGAVRNAFAMRRGRREWVAKIFPEPSKFTNEEANWNEIVVGAAARALTREFNKRVGDLIGRDKAYRAEYAEMCLIRTRVPKPEPDGGEEDVYYMAEEMLRGGRWAKMNSNQGFVAPGYPTAQAFSHFTHHFSGGKVIVVDVQGMVVGNTYRLTDPAIHSNPKTGTFGTTDKSVNGMTQFFETHYCNQVCRALGLPESDGMGYAEEQEEGTMTVSDADDAL